MHQKTAKFDFSEFHLLLEEKEKCVKSPREGKQPGYMPPNEKTGEPAFLREETHPDWVQSIHMGYEIIHGDSHNATLPTSLGDCSNTSEAEKLESEEESLEYNLQKAKGKIEASARTWSHYKHHHTIKNLIGISPQGVIMFISNAYGGRASDKFIVENSDFLNNLNRGDLIIADRGFTIDDSVNIYCAEVRYPSFLSQRKQLSAVDTETTRKLASVRIHVERVIGLLKRKYRILSEEFPIHAIKKGDENYALIDKIVIVCSVFINLCPGILPLD
ncbi:hypothetical protein JTB14_012501 [Gonioctena quinquepunctata]|nr:hypothetical protein JTB14_012501 [Gonioctena quinquepunctata]